MPYPKKKWGWSTPEKPKTDKRKLIKKLDRIFSKYIRLRDTKTGFGLCITCESLISFTNCDAGHFVTRDRIATRYDERNVNAQCYTL